MGLLSGWPRRGPTGGGVAGWGVEPEAQASYGWPGLGLDNQLTGIVGAASLPEGGVVFADGLLGRIVVSDAAGEMISFGGLGGGPSEFGYIASIEVDAEGLIHVLDRERQRLTRWTTGGDLVGEVVLSEEEPVGAFGEARQFDDGSWYLREAGSMLPTEVQGLAQDTVAYVNFRPENEIGNVIVRVPNQLSTQFVVQGMPGTRDALFSPRAVGFSLGSCLAAGVTDDPVFRVLNSDGEQVGTLVLGSMPIDTEDSDRRAWTEGTISMFSGMMGGRMPPEQAQMIEAMGQAVAMAPRMPLAHDVVVDELGFVWVQSYRVPEGPGSPEWRVFSARGEALGRITLPEGLSVETIGRSTVIGVWTGPLGGQEVRVYGLDRGAFVADNPLPEGCELS